MLSCCSVWMYMKHNRRKRLGGVAINANSTSTTKVLVGDEWGQSQQRHTEASNHAQLALHFFRLSQTLSNCNPEHTSYTDTHVWKLTAIHHCPEASLQRKCTSFE